MTMTTKELLALVGVVSELPWVAFPGEVWSLGNNREVARRPDFHTTPTGYGQWDANAALIVAAVNALPALCAEVEALRKDAERYRWLKANVSGGSLGVPGGWIDTITAEWDTAIDAAKEPK